MAIAIDASTPALVSDEVSVTTASFTRPSGSLLVAVLAAYSDDAPIVAGSSLTWTRRVQLQNGTREYAEIWTAESGGGGSTTVSATISGTAFTSAGLKVAVVTGQHATSYSGATGTGSSSTNNLTANGYTSTAAGSRGFFAAFDFNGLGIPTSTDVGFGWTTTARSGISVFKSANTSAAGTSVAFNADAPGTSAADWTWAALEIKPAPDGGRQRAVMSRTAVHRAASW